MELLTPLLCSGSHGGGCGGGAPGSPLRRVRRVGVRRRRRRLLLVPPLRIPEPGRRRHGLRRRGRHRRRLRQRSPLQLLPPPLPSLRRRSHPLCPQALQRRSPPLPRPIRRLHEERQRGGGQRGKGGRGEAVRVRGGGRRGAEGLRVGAGAGAGRGRGGGGGVTQSDPSPSLRGSSSLSTNIASSSSSTSIQWRRSLKLQTLAPQVTGISMESIPFGEDLNGCAFVYGSLSFLDKLSCGLALYALESYRDAPGRPDMKLNNSMEVTHSVTRYGFGVFPAACALVSAVVTYTMDLPDTR